MTESIDHPKTNGTLQKIFYLKRYFVISVKTINLHCIEVEAYKFIIQKKWKKTVFHYLEIDKK